MQDLVIQTTRAQVSALLRAEIFAGQIRSGERLQEAKLAAQLGVSRGTIREAFAELTSEGLLYSKPNCGVTVAPPAAESIRKLILSIRTTLETYALKIIYADLTENDFRKWDAMLFRLGQAARQRDPALVAQVDIELHRSIMERAGEHDLLAIWQTLIVRLRPHFWHRAQVNFARTHAHHGELLAAFRGGDVESVSKALEVDIDAN